MVVADRVQRLAEADQVDRDQLRALVDQLVEAVLAVRARLAPEDGAGLVVDSAAVERHVLAVRLHRELLEVGGEALEVLLVGHHADCLRVEEVPVPDREQPHQDRQVSLERRGSEVDVHLVEAGQHARGTRRVRPRASSRGRSPSPSSSDRRPSPRSRTCCRCRCRTSTPPRRSWRRRRNASRSPTSSPSAASAHSRAVWALVIVSSVVNVFDEMMNSVSSAARSRVASAKSVESTLDTKRKVRSRACSGAGPRTPSPARDPTRRCRY